MTSGVVALPVTPTRSALRALRPVEDAGVVGTASPRTLSPLRYPGAKSNLAPVIGEIVARATAAIGRPELLVEPFAGGASTSLYLLDRNLVDRVLLSDADPLVATFLRVAATQTQWLIDRMNEEEVTLERWDYWKAWRPSHAEDRELAVQCLFLNRTSFSGILHGSAGPIGGRRQVSAYPVDCRFPKPELARRLRKIGAWYESGRILDVRCQDWESVLDDVSEQYPSISPQHVLIYLDPPYVKKSARLYHQSFETGSGAAGVPARSGWLADGAEHDRLADYLCHRATSRWLLSYDYDPRLVTDLKLYGGKTTSPRPDEQRLLGVTPLGITKRGVPLRYSAAGSSTRAAATELLISTLPAECLAVAKSLELTDEP